MKLYITSSPTGNYRDEKPNDFVGFNPANGFVEELRKDWRENSRCLAISATPDDYAGNDAMAAYFKDVCMQTGLSVAEFEVCDYRNYERKSEEIVSYDFILLGGGHVPTQNDFFHKMHLKEAMKGFDGIVMGISAGSMNCAREVYAQPELPGEARDPGYRKYLDGLGFTEIKIIPHYQVIKHDMLDGMHLMEQITYADSFGKEFYVMVDGSYILKRGIEAEEFHGEIYRYKNGKMVEVSFLDGKA